MNELEIVGWASYGVQDINWIYSDYTSILYIKKLVKIKHWFRYVDWIVYSQFEDWGFEKIMTLKKFKSKVLYKVNNSKQWKL